MDDDRRVARDEDLAESWALRQNGKPNHGREANHYNTLSRRLHSLPKICTLDRIGRAQARRPFRRHRSAAIRPKVQFLADAAVALCIYTVLGKITLPSSTDPRGDRGGPRRPAADGLLAYGQPSTALV